MFLLELLFTVLVGLQFSPAERAYLVESVAQQNQMKAILTSFEGKFGKKVSRSQAYRIYGKFKTEYTCHNLNSGRSGRKKTGRSPENIASVKRLLEGELAKKPDEHKASARRNILAGITKSTFNRITTIDLKLKPYKLLRHQKLTQDHCDRRLAMCNFLQTQNNNYFESLVVSDEAWFTVGGHCFNRQNTVVYSPSGQGTPDHWFSEAVQGQQKVMLFVLMTGDGHLFGPYFYDQDHNIDARGYKNMLVYKVFPAMKRELGVRKFNRLVWQQDGASCHTANTVMDYLNTIFGLRMLALKSRQGVDWAPHSPDLNPCDFWLWGYLKSLVYKPMPNNLTSLVDRIKMECQNIPVEMIRRAVLSMKRRAGHCVKVSGRAIEGRKII